MATTTATLILSSADVTGHSFNMTQTATLTKAASSTGLDEFTGITSRKYPSAQTDTVVVADSIYVDTTVAHKVYIRNTSTGNSDYILVELEGNVIIGRLYPGDWMFIPYGGTLDIQVTTIATNVSIEYGVFSQSTVS
jgi:hypothetical protein|tara:strand:+ start:1336 stop:1746 length:411 start_codon:yes stop_codon:yes gene_type:complete